jgi:hypothetical protein
MSSGLILDIHREVIADRHQPAALLIRVAPSRFFLAAEPEIEAPRRVARWAF